MRLDPIEVFKGCARLRELRGLLKENRICSQLNATAYHNGGSEFMHEEFGELLVEAINLAQSLAAAALTWGTDHDAIREVFELLKATTYTEDGWDAYKAFDFDPSLSPTLRTLVAEAEVRLRAQKMQASAALKDDVLARQRAAKVPVGQPVSNGPSSEGDKALRPEEQFALDYLTRNAGVSFSGPDVQEVLGEGGHTYDRRTVTDRILTNLMSRGVRRDDKKRWSMPTSAVSTSNAPPRQSSR